MEEDDRERILLHAIQEDIRALQKLLSADGAVSDEFEPLVRRIKAAYAELCEANPGCRLQLINQLHTATQVLVERAAPPNDSDV